MSAPHAGEGVVLLLVRIEAVIVALVLARDVVGQLVQLQTLGGAFSSLFTGAPEAGEKSRTSSAACRRSARATG